MKISILIPTFNRTEKLKRTIDTIVLQTYPKENLELIIFCDGCREDVVEEIEKYLTKKTKHLFRTELINSQENCGISVARNSAIKKSSKDTQYLLFLDDDVYLSKDTIEVLEKYISENNSVGIVAPRAVFVNSKKTIQSASFINKWTGSFRSKDSNEILECDFVDPLCMLVRKNVAETVGGFNEEYYRSHEGVDFCLKIKKARYKVVYNPNVTVEHDIEPKTATGIRLYYLYRNKIFLIKDHLFFLGKIIGILKMLLLGLPFYILKSVIERKSFVFSEIKLIIQALTDGIFNVKGKKV